MSKEVITLPKSLLLGLAKKEQEMIDEKKDEKHNQMDDFDVMYHCGKRDAFYAVIESYELMIAEDESFLEDAGENQAEK